MVRSAPLSAAVYVERYDGAEPRLSELHQSAMAARMLGNFHMEMTTHSREVVNLLGATGLVPLQDIFADKATILGKALQNVPTFLLQVPVAYDADHASDVIVEQLASVITPLGCPRRDRVMSVVDDDVQLADLTVVIPARNAERLLPACMESAVREKPRRSSSLTESRPTARSKSRASTAPLWSLTGGGASRWHASSAPSWPEHLTSP